MIPIVDGLMKRLVRRLSLEPSLERFRTRVPYFVVVGIIGYLYAAPAAGIILWAQALGYRGTPQVSLTRTWLTIGLAPAGIAAAVAASSLLGRLSGYRPFCRKWQDLSADDARILSDGLCRAAETRGFKTAWKAANGLGFVGIRALELELLTERRGGVVFDGINFPMRLSLFFHCAQEGSYKAVMMVHVRTTVIWNTGEAMVCHAAGKDISAESERATLPSAH